ncbi:MAG: class I SAM-dependent methyltransferase [Candidatus Aenigmatarchaeota archaeon]|nr:MAG: class I SAM-dependent methyltransferase [Candidatus Aenigmarchaeota archaeon]
MFARISAFPRKIVRKIILSVLSLKNGVITFYNDEYRAEIFRLIKMIKRETEMLISYNEAYQIFMAVKGTGKIKGDIAEVGVYRGGSAKLICEAKGERHLHLFDTFEGLPELSENDDTAEFHKGQFSAFFESVKNYLKKYPNVHFYRGLFPSTAESVKNKKFSFVNLDVDIYESTISCLKFFYPRMSKGGIIISHDYVNSIGVRKAIDGFFKDKPEPIIVITGLQCLIVKL